MVLWDLHTRKPKKVFDVPGAPLEIRCAWGANNNYCFTTTALTSELWVIYEDDSGEWHAKKSADIARGEGDPDIPLPVDISITADDKGLWIQTWFDGKTRYFDVSDPFNAKQLYEHKIGEQVNMISQSWRRASAFTSLPRCWPTGIGKRARKICSTSSCITGTLRTKT